MAKRKTDDYAWSAGKDNVVVKPLTGEVKVTGQLSHVVIWPADANRRTR